MDQAGVTKLEVIPCVKRVPHIIIDITSTSQAQSSGIDQINHAITKMDTVTQQNAPLVEEAVAAARTMQDQAASLAQVVSIF